MNPKNAILSAIGNTPLISIDGLWVKCEFLNPSGSIKDRVAKHIVETAERRGHLHPGDTLVEATSGNMGNALAMVAAAKGYKMLVFMPHGFSSERIAISRAYGAEVRMVGQFHLSEAIAEAKAFAKQPGYFGTSQFDNPENIIENRQLLAEEILRQLPAGVQIDALVQGVGTGGTIIGVGQGLREKHNPKLKLFAVEPAESPTIQTGRVGKHQIEGISDGFIPQLFSDHKHEVDDVISITSADAVACMRRLAANYGFFVGPSSGANWRAVEIIRQRFPQIKHILTFFCDEGEKYIRDYF